VAHTLTNSPSDQAQLAPLLDAIKANLGKNPEKHRPMRAIARKPIFARSSDAGSRATSPPDGKSTAPKRPRQKEAQIRHAHRQNEHKAQARRLSKPDRLRKQIVEPVFGQIKQARGVPQFLLRSIDKVKPMGY